MYIGKFLLNSKDLKKPLEVPILFRKPNLVEVNSILKKHDFPTMNKEEFKYLYLNNTRYYNHCIWLGEFLDYSIEFIEKGLKY